MPSAALDPVVELRAVVMLYGLHKNDGGSRLEAIYSKWYMKLYMVRFWVISLQ